MFRKSLKLQAPSRKPNTALSYKPYISAWKAFINFNDELELHG